MDRLCGESGAEATLLPVGKQAVRTVGFPQRLPHPQCVATSLMGVQRQGALGSDFDDVDVAGEV